MRHLDTDALSALDARQPEAVAWFKEHLATPCEACEEFLARHMGPGLLDGQADALLLSAAPARPTPLDEVGWARLRRKLRAPSPARWVGAAAALAACVLAVVLVNRPATPATGQAPRAWDGVKGPGGRMSLELAAVARGADGALRRLDSGASVPEGDVLLLRYHATEAGTGLLFQQSAGGPVELLGRFPLEAGTHDLRGPQGLAGVSLQGESGPLRLWLVGVPAGESPSPEQVRAALAGGSAKENRLLSMTRFDVLVKNGQNPR